MNNGEKEKVKQLQKTVGKIDYKVDEILENHLPHIWAELAALKMKVLIGFTIGGFIIGVLTEYILKNI
jgi:hypothetical protein